MLWLSPSVGRGQPKIDPLRNSDLNDLKPLPVAGVDWTYDGRPRAGTRPGESHNEYLARMAQEVSCRALRAR